MLNTNLCENNNLANQLADQEKLIKRKSKDWYLEGKALLEIRDKKLYLGKYLNFPHYCQEKWGLGKRYANRQISAYLFVSRLGTVVPALPANERQARPFTGLKLELQQAAWEETLRTAPNGEVTAAHADAVVQKYKSGSHLLRPKAGARNTEDITAPIFQAPVASYLQPAVDLSFSQEDEDKIQLKKQLEDKDRVILQLQYGHLLKDKKIEALTTEVSMLRKEVQDNQSQINALRQQVTNLMNQVGQLFNQHNGLSFLHHHLTIHAYNLQQAVEELQIKTKIWENFAIENWRKVQKEEMEEKDEKVIPFFPNRKELNQVPQPGRASN